jgi:hypothetical protein
MWVQVSEIDSFSYLAHLKHTPIRHRFNWRNNNTLSVIWLFIYTMDVSFPTVIKVLCLKLYKSSVNKETFTSNWNKSGYRLSVRVYFFSLKEPITIQNTISSSLITVKYQLKRAVCIHSPQALYCNEWEQTIKLQIHNIFSCRKISFNTMFCLI